MAKESKDKELQQKYLEFQVIGARIKKIREHLDLIDQQCMELSFAVQGLDEFAQSQNGSEILVPVNSGIFARAELKDNKELVVNVGSDICVVKTVDEAKALLDNRLREVVGERNNFALELQRYGEMAQGLEKELVQLTSES